MVEYSETRPIIEASRRPCQGEFWEQDPPQWSECGRLFQTWGIPVPNFSPLLGRKENKKFLEHFRLDEHERE